MPEWMIVGLVFFGYIVLMRWILPFRGRPHGPSLILASGRAADMSGGLIGISLLTLMDSTLMVFYRLGQTVQRLSKSRLPVIGILIIFGRTD